LSDVIETFCLFLYFFPTKKRYYSNYPIPTKTDNHKHAEILTKTRQEKRARGCLGKQRQIGRETTKNVDDRFPAVLSPALIDKTLFLNSAFLPLLLPTRKRVGMGAAY